MAKRFTIRSTTPGAKRLTQAALAVVADYPDVARVLSGTVFANGSLTGTYSGGVTAPARPSLSVVSGSGGVTAVATLAGDSGVTHTLHYKLAADAGWTAGLTRVGNGVITQTGLTAGLRYTFQAVSSLAGVNSLPSVPRDCLVQASATPVVEQLVQAIHAAFEDLVDDATLQAVIRPAQIDETLPLGHLVAQLVQFPVEQIGRDTAYYRKRLRVAIICPIRPEKTDATPIQQYQNFYGAKLENIALAHPRWADPDGKILDDGVTVVHGPFPFQDGRNVDGVFLELEVPFRHLVTDTFAKGA